MTPEPIDSQTPLLEVQVVDAADSIAYDSHDADDALELGLVKFADLECIALWRESASRMRQRYTALSDADLRRATVHELIDRQVNDLYTMVTQAITEREIDSVEALRAAGVIARHSDAMAEQKLELESFLFHSVYRHPSVLGHRAEAAAALEHCFDQCLHSPEKLPPAFASVAAEDSLLRAAGDYVATLTDRAVLEAWRPG